MEKISRADSLYYLTYSIPINNVFYLFHKNCLLQKAGLSSRFKILSTPTLTLPLASTRLRLQLQLRFSKTEFFCQCIILLVIKIIIKYFQNI